MTDGLLAGVFTAQPNIGLEDGVWWNESVVLIVVDTRVNLSLPTTRTVQVDLSPLVHRAMSVGT